MLCQRCYQHTCVCAAPGFIGLHKYTSVISVVQDLLAQTYASTIAYPTNWQEFKASSAFVLSVASAMCIAWLLCDLAADDLHFPMRSFDLQLC